MSYEQEWIIVSFLVLATGFFAGVIYEGHKITDCWRSYIALEEKTSIVYVPRPYFVEVVKNYSGTTHDLNECKNNSGYETISWTTHTGGKNTSTNETREKTK